MRVLLVVHRYPPAHRAGTELYTKRLAQYLLAQGVEVRVFCAEKEVSLWPGTTRERVDDGIAVHEVINNLLHRSLEDTWHAPLAEAAFEAQLEGFRPDIVHVQHLLYLSIRIPALAQKRGIPVVFTAHDFWMQCPRFGQRLDHHQELCETIDLERCARCMGDFKYRQGPLARVGARILASVRSVTGVDLAPAAVRASRSPKEPVAVEASARQEVPVEVLQPETSDTSKGDPVLLAALTERRRAFHEELFGSVDLFTTPSRFLRDELIAEGLDSSRVQWVPTAIDAPKGSPSRARRDRGAAPLRIAFVGSLIPVKGPDLFVDAWSALPEELRSRATGLLVGPENLDPGFALRVKSSAERVGMECRGAVPPADMGALWDSIDLLVVPSRWYENAPLVILEAHAAGVPVLAAGHGGLLEHVSEGRGGGTFVPGNAADLARELTRVLEDPALLTIWADTIPEPAPDHRAWFLATYERLLSSSDS